MGVLEQVSQMKEQGFSEDEIISKLQEQGISPKAINDALNQSQIKNAVSSEEDSYPQDENYSDGQEDYDSYEQSPAAPSYQSSTYPSQQYDSSYEGYGYENNSNGTDTFIEIAQQVFSEKTKEIKKSMTDLNEFKSLSEVKLSNALERIKRIEMSLDKLQMAILEKVGSYGNTLESIKREMSMMQDSFGKALPDLASKHHETHHSTSHPTHKKTVSRKRK